MIIAALLRLPVKEHSPLLKKPSLHFSQTRDKSQFYYLIGNQKSTEQCKVEGKSLNNQEEGTCKDM